MDKLNEDQKGAFRKVVEERKSCFLTGCGGTGKSFLLRQIIDELRNGRGSKRIAVTALTGVAAFNIEGVTLHSFAGIGLGDKDKEELASRANFGPARERWKKVEVLIVDEISMMSGRLFDKLEYIARVVRNNEAPFGGIQLVLTGDMLQLPPIEKDDSEEPRVFEATTWSQCITAYLVLRKVVRQSDFEFVKFLTCIRVGHIDESMSDVIQKITAAKEYDIDCKPVNLYSTRSEVEEFNFTHLDALQTPPMLYEADDVIKVRYGGEKMLENCPAPGTVTLKEGAQVMLVRNINSLLVNGTVGMITKFVDIKLEHMEIPYKVPVVRFTLADGRVITRHVLKETWSIDSASGTLAASRTQIPLILAWAITIHKSQGKTIQHLKVDVSRSFAPGQVYTALSRGVSIETIEVSGFRSSAIKADPKSLKFYLDNDLI